MDAIEVLADAVTGSVVFAVDMRILQLALRLDIPLIIQCFLTSPFDAGLLVPGTEGTLRFIAIEQFRRPFTVDLPNAADDVKVMALLS